MYPDQNYLSYFCVTLARRDRTIQHNLPDTGPVDCTLAEL